MTVIVFPTWLVWLWAVWGVLWTIDAILEITKKVRLFVAMYKIKKRVREGFEEASEVDAPWDLAVDTEEK